MSLTLEQALKADTDRQLIYTDHNTSFIIKCVRVDYQRGVASNIFLLDRYNTIYNANDVYLSTSTPNSLLDQDSYEKDVATIRAIISGGSVPEEIIREIYFLGFTRGEAIRMKNTVEEMLQK